MLSPHASLPPCWDELAHPSASDLSAPSWRKHQGQSGFLLSLRFPDFSSRRGGSHPLRAATAERAGAAHPALVARRDPSTGDTEVSPQTPLQREAAATRSQTDLPKTAAQSDFPPWHPAPPHGAWLFLTLLLFLFPGYYGLIMG